MPANFFSLFFGGIVGENTGVWTDGDQRTVMRAGIWGVSLPMGILCNPKSFSSACTSGTASSETAISNPPLVWGSARMALAYEGSVFSENVILLP